MPRKICCSPRPETTPCTMTSGPTTSPLRGDMIVARAGRALGAGVDIGGGSAAAAECTAAASTTIVAGLGVAMGRETAIVLTGGLEPSTAWCTAGVATTRGGYTTCDGPGT